MTSKVPSDAFKKMFEMCRHNNFLHLKQTKADGCSLHYGPLGTLLKRNIFNEWLSSHLNSSEVTIFPLEISNPRETAFHTFESSNEYSDSMLSDVIGACDIISSPANTMPCGYAVYGPCVNRNVQTNNPASSLDLSRLQAWTRLSVIFFCPIKKSMNWFHHWSKQRYLWWRKYSSIPSKFSMSDVTTSPNGNHQLSLLLEFPWGKQPLETITLHNEIKIPASLNDHNVRKSLNNYKDVMKSLNDHKDFKSSSNDYNNVKSSFNDHKDAIRSSNNQKDVKKLLNNHNDVKMSLDDQKDVRKFLNNRNMSFDDHNDVFKGKAAVVTCETELDLAVLAYLSNSFSEKWRNGEAKNLFQLHYKLAPCKVCLFLDETDAEHLKKLKSVAIHLLKELKDNAISVLPTVQSDVAVFPSNRFDKFDEMGLPYTIVLNENSVLTGIAGIRNRDTTLQEQVHITELTAKLVKYLKIR